MFISQFQKYENRFHFKPCVPVIGLLSVAVLPRWVVQLQGAEEFQKSTLKSDTESPRGAKSGSWDLILSASHSFSFLLPLVFNSRILF